MFILQNYHRLIRLDKLAPRSGVMMCLNFHGIRVRCRFILSLNTLDYLLTFSDFSWIDSINFIISKVNITMGLQLPHSDQENSRQSKRTFTSTSRSTNQEEVHKRRSIKGEDDTESQSSLSSTTSDEQDDILQNNHRVAQFLGEFEETPMDLLEAIEVIIGFSRERESMYSTCGRGLGSARKISRWFLKPLKDIGRARFLDYRHQNEINQVRRQIKFLKPGFHCPLAPWNCII